MPLPTPPYVRTRDTLAGLPVLTPGQLFAWDQEAQSLDEAQLFVYRYYLDMSATAVIIPAVQVGGPQSPFNVSFLAPIMPAGQHRIEFTAQNDVGESARSIPFDFMSGSAPAPPKNVHII